MAVTLADMKAHLNVTTSDDDDLISDQISSAEAHLAAWLGFDLDDAEEFPSGRPADLDQAVKMLAAHWYENREGTMVGQTVMDIPFAVEEVIRNYRTWSF
ncbi:MAG: head-tail connector protein [Hyphomicrobiaceae bacterium]|nr:head-tail connector protein [Hyphomicrobiaceae bacterium]